MPSVCHSGKGQRARSLCSAVASRGTGFWAGDREPSAPHPPPRPRVQERGWGRPGCSHKALGGARLALLPGLGSPADLLLRAPGEVDPLFVHPLGLHPLDEAEEVLVRHGGASGQHVGRRAALVVDPGGLGRHRHGGWPRRAPPSSWASARRPRAPLPGGGRCPAARPAREGLPPCTRTISSAGTPAAPAPGARGLPPGRPGAEDRTMPARHGVRGPPGGLPVPLPRPPDGGAFRSPADRTGGSRRPTCGGAGAGVGPTRHLGFSAGSGAERPAAGAAIGAGAAGGWGLSVGPALRLVGLARGRALLGSAERTARPETAAAHTGHAAALPAAVPRAS